jgi:hypothetical protein
LEWFERTGPFAQGAAVTVSNFNGPNHYDFVIVIASFTIRVPTTQTNFSRAFVVAFNLVAAERRGKLDQVTQEGNEDDDEFSFCLSGMRILVSHSEREFVFSSLL